MRSLLCVALAVLAANVLATSSHQLAAYAPAHRRLTSVHKKRLVGGLKRTKRCSTKTTGLLGASVPVHTSTHVSTPSVPKPTIPSQTLAGAVPLTTKATSADPYLLALSKPLNYKLDPEFVREKTSGVMTYYAQGQTACGDTYDDTTYTAAISHITYDAWPGASGETNRNPVCGPFVPGRYFLLPTDVRVPGTSHATMGGDGLINCQLGEQCHVPLTATVTNPATGVSLRVAIVDRCEGCVADDIDLAPAAFLKLTVPHLDTSGFALTDYMAEASKNAQGRVPVSWKFDPVQQFAGVHGERKSGCTQGCIVGA